MNSYNAYQLDPSSAKQADAGGRIDQSGKYTGVLKSVEFVTAKSGAQGLEIHFESDHKEYTTFTVWSFGRDGQKLMGLSKVNAMMTCAKVRALTPVERQLEKYDYDTKSKIKVPCTVAQELDNKRIGVVLQRENYKNASGEDRVQMNLFASFDPDTELTAKEILEKATQPQELSKIIERLMGNPVITRKQQGQSNAAPAGSSNPQSTDLDNDLPF